MEWLNRLALMPYTDEPGDPGGGGGDQNEPADKKSADDSAAGDQTDKADKSKANDPGKGDGDASKRRPSGDDTSWEKKQAALLADLKKERKARQDFESRFKTLESSLEAERKRVKALAGLDVPSDEDKEIAGYRERVQNLLPWTKKLSEEKVDKLLELLNNADGIRQTADHVWRSHGRTMVGLAMKEVSEAIGGDLTERQQKTLTREFIAAVEADPELVERYEAGDPTLAKDVAKILIEDWVTPSRRNYTAQQVNKFPRVPAGKDRGAGGGRGPKKINWSDPKSVEDAMVESYREHGGEFGG